MDDDAHQSQGDRIAIDARKSRTTIRYVSVRTLGTQVGLHRCNRRQTLQNSARVPACCRALHDALLESGPEVGTGPSSRRLLRSRHRVRGSSAFGRLSRVWRTYPVNGIGRDKQYPDVGSADDRQAQRRPASPAVGDVAAWTLPGQHDDRLLAGPGQLHSSTPELRWVRCRHRNIVPGRRSHPRSGVRARGQAHSRRPPPAVVLKPPAVA
jgi:hypothetical protein